MIILKKQRISLPMRHRRNLAKRIVVILRCAHSGWRSQTVISAVIFKRKKSRDPDPDVEVRKDWKMYYGRLHISESCCSKNETLFSERRFSDTIELHWCPETNENEYWCTSWSNHRWWLKYWWRQSRCLNLGSTWQNSNCSRKAH